MNTINEILANPDFLALRDIYKLSPTLVFQLASHPKASVRYAAALHAIPTDMPLFINDPDRDIRIVAVKRLRGDWVVDAEP